MDNEKIVTPLSPEEVPCCESPCGACGGCGQKSAAPTDETITVVDVQFQEGGKTYYFDPAGLDLKAGDHVIMDTSRGAEYGICCSRSHAVSASDVVSPLRKVLRLATEQDKKTKEQNRQKEKDAFRLCQQKIQEQKLDMQLCSAEYAFDGSKILFFFTAEGRVDFRELVKNLASALHTRIELRQIGVRDKAKMVGGLGICGKPFCCKEFLDDFQPVSIKMAKTQNLSLNPTKISGTCGRLMCCLKYEQEAYEDLMKTVPKQDSFVDTPDGRGTVTDVNLLRQSVRVRMEKNPDAFGNYKVEDIYVIRNGKAKKTDPPIDENFAPISSKPASLRRAEEEEVLPDVVFHREKPVESAPEEKPETQPKREGRNHRRRSRPHSGESRPAPQEAASTGEEKPARKSNHRRHRPHRRPGGNQ